jgi:hypothetical protein
MVIAVRDMKGAASWNDVWLQIIYQLATKLARTLELWWVGQSRDGQYVLYHSHYTEQCDLRRVPHSSISDTESRTMRYLKSVADEMRMYVESIWLMWLNYRKGHANVKVIEIAYYIMVWYC